jgi:hypothetical protein
VNRRFASVVVASLVPAAAFAAQSWRNYGRDQQHSALAGRSAQPLQAIHWHAPVDLDPQYSGGDLFIHYGTPLVTARNTVVFPVKTGASGGFRVDARSGKTGAPLWSFDTDYVLPAHGWTPSCGACLAAGDRVVVPASGGTLLVRLKPDVVGTPTKPIDPTRIAFYGIENYVGAQKAAFDQHVFISSPVVSDARGTLYFTFRADAGAPLSISSGVARIPMKGAPSWIKASEAAGDATITAPALNAAPALSRDGRTLYVAVRGDDSSGYVCALDAKTLARKASMRLKDPLRPDEDAEVNDDSTASPSVGPDGDVYFGVLESATSFNYLRGWLLHFDGKLASTKTPGSFGWDDTASIVPRAAAPSYKGKSKYLLLTKYNDYVEGGGTGVNKIAVLDPGVGAADPRTDVGVMKEVLTIAGPTPDLRFRDAAHPDAVREWCINTAAIDAKGKCALVNNEDGVLYRWDFRTNTLSQSVVLTSGVGEAYTPTVVGPDGTAYAINNAVLFAVGKKPKQ